MKQKIQSKYKIINFKFKKLIPCRIPFCICQDELDFILRNWDTYLAGKHIYYKSANEIVAKLEEEYLAAGFKIFPKENTFELARLFPRSNKDKFHYWLIYEIG